MELQAYRGQQGGLVAGAQGGEEDGGVEDDGVDAGELLEEGHLQAAAHTAHLGAQLWSC